MKKEKSYLKPGEIPKVHLREIRTCFSPTRGTVSRNSQEKNSNKVATRDFNGRKTELTLSVRKRDGWSK